MADATERPSSLQDRPRGGLKGRKIRQPARGLRRTLTGLRHSPDSVCGRTSRHTGTRTPPATQQPFGYLWGSHGPALVTSVIQTARQWRDRTAGTSLGPPPQGPPGRPRRAKPPPTSSPAQAQPRPHARTPARAVLRNGPLSLSTAGVLSHLLCGVTCFRRSILGPVQNLKEDV